MLNKPVLDIKHSAHPRHTRETFLPISILERRGITSSKSQRIGRIHAIVHIHIVVIARRLNTAFRPRRVLHLQGRSVPRKAIRRRNEALRLQDVPVRAQDVLQRVVVVDAEALGLAHLHGLDVVEVVERRHEVRCDDGGGLLVAGLAEHEHLAERRLARGLKRVFAVPRHVRVDHARGVGEAADQIVERGRVDGGDLGADFARGLYGARHAVFARADRECHGDAFADKEVLVFGGDHWAQVEPRQDHLRFPSALVGPV